MAGNVKLILALIWMLIQKYHIQSEDAKRSMLDWVQVRHYQTQLPSWIAAAKGSALQTEGPFHNPPPLKVVIPEAEITNFTVDWNDGRAISALVEVCLPGSIKHWATLDPANAVENITNAMQVKN